MNPDDCQIQLPDELSYKFSDAQICSKHQYKTGICDADDGNLQFQNRQKQVLIIHPLW